MEGSGRHDFVRRLTIFVAKRDLAPFEEAKLYGHNATHALIGYLAERKGCKFMSDAGRDRDLARWWMIDHAGPRRYLASLTPDYVRDLAGGELDRGAPFALSRLLRELHAGSDTYPDRYDIEEPCGRIGFIYDLLLNLYDTPIRRQIFEGPVEAWFRGRLGGVEGAISAETREAG